MAKSAPIRPHPLCAAFPDMSPEEYANLRWSIQQQGYDKAQPVMLFEDRILDGRHRYRAARELDVEVPIREFKGSQEEAIEYVQRANLARRHLTPSQLAMVGAGLKPFFEKAAEMRMKTGKTDPSDNCPEGGKASEKAADAVGVSAKSVERAEFVADNSAKLAEKVLAGEMSLNAAVVEIKQKEERKGPPPRPVKAPEPTKIGDIIREGRELFAEIQEQLKCVRRDLADLPDDGFGRELNQPRIKLAFDNIENFIKFAVPYCTCPMNDPCDKNCRLCHGAQWITREQKERYDERNKT